MITRIRLLVLGVVAVMVQAVVFPHLRIDGVLPDVALLAAVGIAYREGPEAGATFGFAVGLGLDLFLRTPLGLSALSFALTCSVVGVVQRMLLRASWWVAPLLGAFSGLLAGTLFVTIGAIVGQEQLFAVRSIRVILVASAYDALLAPLMFACASWAVRDREARSSRL